MPTAFVTGGTGFLGLNLVEQLRAGDWRVVALHRATSDVSRLSRFGLELVQGAIGDRASLERAIPQGVDAVFHVAGNTSVWSRAREQQTRDNVDGTRNVLDAARMRGARKFVHTSSFAAYGHHRQRITEETPSNAAASSVHYVRTKRLGEQEVERAAADGFDAVILNPAHIVGHFDTTNWARMFQLVRQGKLPGIPPGEGTWCHSVEVARAHIAAAERGRRGEHYLLGGVDATFREVVELIARLTGSAAPRRILPARVLRMVGMAKELASRFTNREPDITADGALLVSESLLCDSSKAIRELGYQPASLETMFRDCHEWLTTEAERSSS